MKKILLSLLVIVLILGALGAVGFAGYQFGYRQAATSTTNGNAPVAPRDRNFNFGPGGMPMHDFGFHHGFGPRGFGMMNRGMGFGFFSPLMFLLRIAFWALVIWVAYMLFTRSGWRLTRQSTETPPAPAAPSEPHDDQPAGD